MELTKEKIDKTVRQDWSSEPMAQWLDYVQKQAESLKVQFDQRVDIASRYPLSDGFLYYMLDLFRETLRELQVAIEQIDLLSAGKEETHVLVTKAVSLGPVPSKFTAEPSDGGNAD